MKKGFSMLLILLLTLTGCGRTEEQPKTTETAHTVQLANPWVSYDILTEAEKAVGFSLNMPETIEAFRAESFRVMNGALLEVRYRDGVYEVIVRTQLGEGQDLSGVYDTFETETVYKTGDSWIISRSSEQKRLDLIDSSGCSWSLYAPDGYPGDCHGSFLNAVLGQPEPWIREANEAFNATISKNGGAARACELSCFFTSTWHTPEEIDLAEFLRYCPLGEQLLDETTEEARAVTEAMGENPFAVTPVWRYPKEAVSALLCKYTGITVEDLLSLEGVLYLEKYDAFYNCTSDWGPGRFLCTGGERTGNQITLWSEGNGDTARVLTIREENGEYFLVSHLEYED